MFSSGIPADTADERGNTAMSLACQTGNKKMAKLCLRWGAKVNQQNLQGQTPLHFCFAYHYDELGAYLISKGADDTMLNYFGWTCYEGLRPEDPNEALGLLQKHLGSTATLDMINIARPVAVAENDEHDDGAANPQPVARGKR